MFQKTERGKEKRRKKKEEWREGKGKAGGTEGENKYIHCTKLLEFMSQESTRIKNFKEIKMCNMNGELKFKL